MEFLEPVGFEIWVLVLMAIVGTVAIFILSLISDTSKDSSENGSGEGPGNTTSLEEVSKPDEVRKVAFSFAGSTLTGEVQGVSGKRMTIIPDGDMGNDVVYRKVHEVDPI